MSKKKIKLSSLIPNSENPRLKNPLKFEKLKTSLKFFPKMMRIRPMVIDEKNIILGGNMRYHVLIESGIKEIPEEWVKKESDLTKKEKNEFIIKDNVSFGEWDFQLLDKNFDNKSLLDWGLENYQLGGNNDFDPGKEWDGMPEYKNEDTTSYKSLTIHFADEKAVENFAKLLKQKITEKTKFLWYPKAEIETYADKKYA